MRCVAFAVAVLLAGDIARAQTTNLEARYNYENLDTGSAWWRFGLVTQRTRVYQSDREIERGLMAGFSVKRADFTAYVFNPDEDNPRFVLAVAVTF